MIGMVGTHRTGKTTLSRALARAADLKFARTTTSEVFAALGMDPKRDYDFKTRLFIQGHILEALQAVYREAGSHFVTDRTPLDLLAYTMADVQRETLDADAESMLADYEARCLELMNRHIGIAILVEPGLAVVDAADKGPAGRGYREHHATLCRGLVADPRVSARVAFIARDCVALSERVAKSRAFIMRTIERANEAHALSELH